MRNNSQNSEILKNLYAFLEVDSDEIRNTPLSEIQAELIAEGIDTEEFLRRMTQRFNSIKAMESLAKSRHLRLKIVEVIKEKMKGFSDNLSDKPEVFINQFKSTFNLSDQDVKAYCRKFEGASKKDQISLFQDFIILKELGENEEIIKKACP